VTFPVWSVVRVPFPYADRPVRQFRPALVVAVPPCDAEIIVLWVLMITSARNPRWLSDVPIVDLHDAGLRTASVVRVAKVATVDARDVAPLGGLSEAGQAAVRAAVTRIIGFG